MIKRIIFIVLVGLGLWINAEASTGTQAEDDVDFYRVVGAVIDETGNPLPGALVTSKNGMEAVTDADGTFSIFLAPEDDNLTATYPGMITKKKGIKEQPVVFELKEKPQRTGPLDQSKSFIKESFKQPR